MATITGITKAAWIAAQNLLIVSAAVDANTKHLIFTRYDGSTLDAGQVGGLQGPPGSITSSPAGGDLTGNYPNPTVANAVITAAKIALATITDAQVAAANKDGVATKPSMRTLGTGAQQAAAGNHTHPIPLLRCGVLSHTADSPNTKTKITYANVFPAGYFSVIPDVVLTIDSNTPENVPYYAVSDRTLTGFAITATRTTASATNFHYMATQQAS